jgi:Mn2+/Fe2+ NRAMP family transporter
MGKHTNSRTYNVVAWTTSVAMILLTLGLLYISIFVPERIQSIAAPGR